MNRNGQTILMVTHDVLSASYCDRIFFMQDGVIKAKVEKVRENRQEFFSKILDAMSKMEGRRHQDEYVVMDKADQGRIPREMDGILRTDGNVIKVEPQDDKVILRGKK